MVVVFGSSCIGCNKLKEIGEEGPSMMGKDESFVGGVVGEDVEEGEISDSASVEEISEEDFNKQDVAKDSDSKPPNKAGGGDGRVWTINDLYNYSGFRGYTSGLYNLAWARAVQNKPLNEIFLMEVDPDDSSKRSSSSPSVNSSRSRDDHNNAKDVDKVVIDDDSGDEMDATDKEEGELEEGEIDLMDPEPAHKAAPAAAQEAKPVAADLRGGASDDVVDLESSDYPGDKELEKRLNSVNNSLESVCMIAALK